MKMYPELSCAIAEMEEQVSKVKLCVNKLDNALARLKVKRNVVLFVPSKKGWDEYVLQHQPIDIQNFFTQKLNNDVLNQINDYLEWCDSRKDDEFWLIDGIRALSYTLDETVNFGKYEGRAYRDLPPSYVDWMLKNMRPRDFDTTCFLEYTSLVSRLKHLRNMRGGSADERLRKQIYLHFNGVN